MEKVKTTNSVKEMINWTEVSLILTNDETKVRSNFIPKEHRKTVAKLKRYLAEWINKNSKIHHKVPQVDIVVDGRRKRIPSPKVVPVFRIIDKLPEGAVQLSPKLFQFHNLYYTKIFSVERGVEIRKWYKADKAKEYAGYKDVI